MKGMKKNVDEENPVQLRVLLRKMDPSSGDYEKFIERLAGIMKIDSSRSGWTEFIEFIRLSPVKYSLKLVKD